jgi:hypothetical protein
VPASQCRNNEAERFYRVRTELGADAVDKKNQADRENDRGKCYVRPQRTRRQPGEKTPATPGRKPMMGTWRAASVYQPPPVDCRYHISFEPGGR